MTFIFFSKDRAAQLDLALRSLFRHLKLNNFKVFCLYTVSNGMHKLGYDRLINEWSEFVTFVPEIKFKEQYLELINGETYVLNLADDIFFIDDIDLTDKYFKIFENRNDMIGFSCRLGKNVTVAWSSEGTVPRIPKLSKFNAWSWVGGGEWETWYYPAAVCGQIFKVSDLKPYATSLSFRNPSTFEAAMYKKPMDKKYMICPDHSWLLEISANRVTNEVNHPKFGKQHQDGINEKWLNGYRIIYPEDIPQNIMINTDYELKFDKE